jgi:GH18 family chitinase
VPVIVSIGGGGLHLVRAIRTAAKRTLLISKMMQFMRLHGYDGWDIDLEKSQDNDWGLSNADTTNYKNFITDLRDSLNTHWAVWNADWLQPDDEDAGDEVTHPEYTKPPR